MKAPINFKMVLQPVRPLPAPTAPVDVVVRSGMLTAMRPHFEVRTRSFVSNRLLGAPTQAQNREPRVLMAPRLAMRRLAEGAPAPSTSQAMTPSPSTSVAPPQSPPAQPTRSLSLSDIEIVDERPAPAPASTPKTASPPKATSKLSISNTKKSKALSQQTKAFEALQRQILKAEQRKEQVRQEEQRRRWLPESQPHLVFPADSLIGKQLTAKGYTTLTAKERSYISKSTDAELFASTINLIDDALKRGEEMAKVAGAGNRHQERNAILTDQLEAAEQRLEEETERKKTFREHNKKLQAKIARLERELRAAKASVIKKKSTKTYKSRIIKPTAAIASTTSKSVGSKRGRPRKVPASIEEAPYVVIDGQEDETPLPQVIDQHLAIKSEPLEELMDDEFVIRIDNSDLD